MNNNEKEIEKVKDFEEVSESEDAEETSQIEKRDIEKDKKKLKKGVKTVLLVFGGLLLLLGILYLVDYIIHLPPKERELNPWLFFEPDYDKNIYEDEAYMALNRNIYFDYMGFERAITEENVEDYPDKGAVAAAMFIDYFECVINGDYENYSSFFTEKCLNDRRFQLPEKFTMQALYDIKVSIKHSPKIEGDVRTEVYEVSYRIFENNGTFRKDIYPDEARTLVFAVEIIDGEAKISAIAHIADG